MMIKSCFIQLHFSNGNIGNTRHRKASKNYTLFKNNKMVFLYPFFSHTTVILFQVAKKKQKKETGKCFFIFILRLIARRFISKTKAENQENGDLQDYPLRAKLNLFVGFVEYNKFFTHLRYNTNCFLLL